MSKPEDIPQDVMKAAEIAWAETVTIHEGIGSDNVLWPISRAILAEREASAGEIIALRNIISKCATACGALVHPGASLDFMQKLPLEIVAAIRKGGE